MILKVVGFYKTFYGTQRIGKTLNLNDKTIILKKYYLNVFFWDMPCVAGFGSCTFDDVCKMLTPPCAANFIQNKIPCTW